MSDSVPDRVERDALGEVRVPAGALYGPQTARAAGWTWSRHRMPLVLVHALGRIKACSARVHGRDGRMPRATAAAIERAAREVADGRHDEQFVVDLFQTGSGTSSNMNANEVVAARAEQLLREAGDRDTSVHPNDDVNRAQSSNDVVPSAMQVALVTHGHAQLLPAIDAMLARLHELADRHWPDLRDGRTHLMRATPVRFGQQFRGYAEQLDAIRGRLVARLEDVAALPLGGTAVGTGVGCPDGFAAAVCAELSRELPVPVRETPHHLGAQGCLDAVTWYVAGLGAAAATLFKVTGDLRWQASDALGQLELPAMQPGSSIMPGKVNPVVCEAVQMACVQVHGHAAAVSFAGSQGQFELTTMIPVLAHNAFEAAELFGGALATLERCALDGLRIADGAGDVVHDNPILATGLNEAIGYDQASAIAKRALAEGRSVFEVAREHTDLADDELRRLLDPERLCGSFGAPVPGRAARGS